MDYVDFDPPSDPDRMTFDFRVDEPRSSRDALRTGLEELLPSATLIGSTAVVLSDPAAIEDLNLKRVVSRTRDHWTRCVVGFAYELPDARGDVAVFENRARRITLDASLRGEEGYYGWDSSWASGGVANFVERTHDDETSPWKLLPESHIEQVPPKDDVVETGAALENLADP